MFENILNSIPVKLQQKKALSSIFPFILAQPPQEAEGRGPGRLGAGGETLVSPPLQVVSQGIDTVVISYQAEISEELLERLKVKKSEVQNTDDACRFLPFGSTKLFSFNLARTGNKLYPYILRTADFTLMLSTRSVKSSIPNMQVSVGSMSCNNNLSDLLTTFKRWCLHHLILIKTEKVSRVDLYADMAVSIDTLSLWNQAKMITRAEKVALYYSNRKLTGLQVGSGDIVLRIYDKIQEMIDKQAGHKSDFFQRIWGNVEKVVRVEFQLRRGAVKSLSPEKNDFFAITEKAGEIWHYLTFDWFRQTAKAVDRLNKNQGKATTSAFWISVQTAFDACDKSGATRDKTVRVVNVEALVDQAAGLMISVCASLGYVFDDIFGIFTTTGDLIKERMFNVMQAPHFETDFSSRATRATMTF